MNYIANSEDAEIGIVGGPGGVVPVSYTHLDVYKRQQRGQALVLNQISDMKKHIEEVEKLYRDIRSMRHDMGNHLQTLEHLVAHNDMDDAAEYLEHLRCV